MIARVVTRLIRGYQRLVSPLLPRSCRFHPTCSEYTVQAIAKHGAARGLLMGLRRIGRCHPWSEGGHDPVPEVGVRHGRRVA